MLLGIAIILALLLVPVLFIKAFRKINLLEGRIRKLETGQPIFNQAQEYAPVSSLKVEAAPITP